MTCAQGLLRLLWGGGPKLECYGTGGRCLERFWNLKKEVGNFMTENGSPVPQLEDGKWLLDFCFLVDITTKLNELNKKLQGKDKLITDCYEDVQLL